MFTGIVQAKGEILRLEPRGGDCRLTVATGKLPLAGVALGDSIAVNGVCLTAVQLKGNRFAADVSRETLTRTTFGELGVGSPVNLELALTPRSRLGGHIVSGHVDGVGEIQTLREDGRSVRMAVKVPPPLARYIAEKGSICVDGVSLTVNAVKGCWFEVNLVPHTLTETTLGDVRPGQRVNLEVDLLARYLERLLLGDAAADTKGAGLTPDLLRNYGFLPDSS
jgi:riboflavin synthase